jgi:murein DD-endopeptidase MepM/ murein hydrolase activator NlpD
VREDGSSGDDREAPGRPPLAFPGGPRDGDPLDDRRAPRGRRDHARPIRRSAVRAADLRSTDGRRRGRARLAWGAAACVAVVALLGAFMAGVFDIGSGGDARAAGAAGAIPSSEPVDEPAAASEAPAPAPSDVESSIDGVAPTAPTTPRHLRAQPGPDGLPVVPGPGSTAADPTTLTGYVWPLRVGRVTQPYGPSPFGTWVVGGELFHDGIDIASYCGDRVRAAHDGVVLAAGRRYDDQLGWIGDLAAYKARNDEKKLWYSLPITIVVDDGNGYRSIYAHLNDIVVKTGDEVKAGQFIGWEGNSGNASGCHLHYGLFSPDETATFATQGQIAKKMKLPAFETARVDPTRALPPMPRGIEPAEPDATPTIAPGSSSGPPSASPMP